MRSLAFFYLILSCILDTKAAEVNYNRYIGPNKEMTQEYKNLISLQVNANRKLLLKSAFDFATQNIRYSFKASSLTTVKIRKKNIYYLSCTGLISEIFNSIGLEYPYVSSDQMVQEDQRLDDFFDFIKLNRNAHEKGFRPQTGDILAFNGHAVLVIDPYKCVAINSTSWVWPSANVLHDASKRGVYFQQVTKGNCENGLWTSWDNSKNRFTVLLRHRELAENVGIPPAILRH